MSEESIQVHDRQDPRSQTELSIPLRSPLPPSWAADGDPPDAERPDTASRFRDGRNAIRGTEFVAVPDAEVREKVGDVAAVLGCSVNVPILVAATASATLSFASSVNVPRLTSRSRVAVIAPSLRILPALPNRPMKKSRAVTSRPIASRTAAVAAVPRSSMSTVTLAHIVPQPQFAAAIQNRYGGRHVAGIRRGHYRGSEDRQVGCRIRGNKSERIPAVDPKRVGHKVTRSLVDRADTAESTNCQLAGGRQDGTA